MNRSGVLPCSGLLAFAIFFASGASSFARSLDYSNAAAVPVVVEVTGSSVVPYVVQANSPARLALEESAASVRVLDLASGVELFAPVALPAGDSVASSYGAFAVVAVPPAVVHVRNPTQGMEFVLFGLGFLCAAVTWRFILGRW